jgi:pimeloyl-ACP methyl ester carboxylesterase
VDTEVRQAMTVPSQQFDVEVRGGRLHVGRWGDSGPAVLAVHGITATHLGWAEVAAALPDVSLLAPDLRGRGRSAHLPGPYGMAAHAADMVDLLDAVGCERAVVAGHSMGGFVAVALAALHPDRVSRLVLIDGGLPTGRPEDPLPPGGIEAALGPAAARLSMTFPSREAHHEFWRAHPAIGPIWGPTVQAYVDYDLVGEPPELHSSCREEAMRADAAEVADHARAAAMLERVTAPMTFLRAERGLLNGEPFYSPDLVDVWTAAGRLVEARTVAGTNHYSLVMAPDGAATVARAVTDALAGAAR